ncbi:hypothetical protein UA08_02082 [Talaromyces atroroseus]|uniref:C3H1-type domain-containing protein n=1 Tax=Talaromyces atroroseus TaxID=1441469 RepID=A0A1Q5QAJ1_TALAT|nr:hypothetical protein UA08_02082 [Talaromyces atroroseus]OKL62940.1 hypothetical protein UA08_02082 [Talaromyces atroroseus]
MCIDFVMAPRKKKDEKETPASAFATKVLKEMHDRKKIEARAAGKQIVYHAIQQVEAGVDATNSNGHHGQPNEDLQGKTSALKTREKELRERLAALNAIVPIAVLRQQIAGLDEAKASLISEISNLSAEASSDEANRVCKEDIDRIDQEWGKWNHQVVSRKRIFLEFWAKCTEVLPPDTTQAEMKVSRVIIKSSLQPSSSQFSSHRKRQREKGKGRSEKSCKKNPISTTLTQFGSFFAPRLFISTRTDFFSRSPPSPMSQSHQHHQHFPPSLTFEEQGASLSHGPPALSHIYYHNPSSGGPGEMRTRNTAAAAAVGQNNNTSTTPTPTTPNGHGHAHARNLSGAAPFEMTARSPPNTSAAAKSTFFLLPRPRLGNCKFGAKCALAHILPDGRRVNRPNYGPGGGGGGSHLNLGGRVNPQAFQSQDSALTNSVLSQQRLNGQDARYAYQYAGGQDDLLGVQPHHHQQQQQQAMDGLGLSTSETPLVSDSKYGSPVDDGRLPTSPPAALTLRDVQLPASFDSQGISHVARYGPVAASVPSQFGLDLASPPTHRAPSDALRSLRDTAFGSDIRKPTSNFGSSPPAILEDSIGSRFLHSQRMVPRSKVLSASVPRPSMLDDWDDNFAMEEDYLPGNLHDDVLTPQEKMRRLSRTEHELSSSQRDFGAFGSMTGTSANKVGSPLASSPSRFGALFARQRQKKEEEALVGGGSGTAASSLNHVGSPLRESSLHFMSSPNLRPIGSRPTSGDISPFVSSPTNRHQSSMSMISQQLHNMSLPTTGSTRQQQPSPSSNNYSSSSTTRFDRIPATSPMTYATSRIDEEEQSDLVFSMEEEESNKRNSVVWNNHQSFNHNNNDDSGSKPTSPSSSTTTKETPILSTTALEYQS